MKLRIRGNSVRLRLTRDETARLAETGLVEETVEFPSSRRFVYALETDEKAALVSADFEADRLCVRLPAREAERWINSAQTGIAADAPGGPDRRLKILVEKDFACLKRRAGDEDRDAFPNPGEGEKC